jgi:hypothetical protein
MKSKRVRSEPAPEKKGHDYPERLAELEGELSANPARQSGTTRTALPSLTRVEAGKIGGEAVVKFTHKGNSFAIGHTDVTFPGTNGSRGIRRIHLYDEDGKIVLGIAGEFDNHALGVNFRSPELKTYHPGPWEDSFALITTGLRTFRTDRREHLRQIRARASGPRA